MATLVLGALALYQGTVQIPRLRQGLEQARVLPAFQLMASSRGEPLPITIGSGTPSFAIAADIPPDVRYFQIYVFLNYERGHSVQLAGSSPSGWTTNYDSGAHEGTTLWDL